jgi:AraC-like DNA-binding protein
VVRAKFRALQESRVMDALKAAVRNYASRHSDDDGLALTPVPGLRMMCVDAPRGPLQSTYKPLVCLVLQGAKCMIVGTHERTFHQGQSVIVSADMPVTGRIVQASRTEPYLAVAVELDMSLLREIAVHLGSAPARPPRESRSLFVDETNDAMLDCAMRLMRLLDRPEAIPVLHPGILRELHYWLLAGQHGSALSALTLPGSCTSRLSAAIAILRKDYRSRIPVERLAASAAMSLTAFHKHFKSMTSLTPGQFQKRMRLIEARRLILNEGATASRAALDVGYESISQFTREYSRMFGAPPKRDSRRALPASKATDSPGVAQP